MKNMKDLNDLMEEQLRDMFDQEKKVVEVLPKFHNKACDRRLKLLIQDYREKSKNQIMRLRQAFSLIYKQKRGEQSYAIKAMLKEGEDLIDRSMDENVMDVAIVTSIQHIIHYQIAGYGAICNYANVLNLYDVAALTHKNLEEKKATDRKLVKLADEVLNIKAKMCRDN